MIDLSRLRDRLVTGEPITPEEGVEIIAELEVSRRLIEPDPEGTGRSLGPHRDLVAQLLMNLSAGIAGEREARLVAEVVVQELTGLIRLRVRSEETR